MRIYIMTDLEGVAGVLNATDWCYPHSRYFERAKELLTQEVNAAIEGFFAAGVTEITVADGHGCGGIDPLLLDPRAELLRGTPTGYPLLLDRTYDAVAFVGQHARAGSEYAHLAHTQGWDVLDLSVNGLSIGEFGQFGLCALELGVPVILCTGDLALCREATALVPGVEAVAVKRGTTPGTGDELDAESYAERNTSAIHLHPLRARALIRQGAERAARHAHRAPRTLPGLAPPYELVLKVRPRRGQGGAIGKAWHPASIAALLNTRCELEPLEA